MFQPGDKVICINPRDSLQLNTIYVIARQEDELLVKLVGFSSRYYASRFVLWEDFCVEFGKPRKYLGTELQYI